MSKFKAIKTDENDWSVVLEKSGENIPVAMNILDKRVAQDIARHLNLSKDAPRSQLLFRSRHPDADLVITAGKGFHIRFANGRGASVQWGTGNYCQNQDRNHGREWFEVQIKDDFKRQAHPELEGTNIYYEQMFADWGSDDAEISPSYSDTEEGWVKPDKIVEILYHISKLPALEGNKEPIDVEKTICKLVSDKEDDALLMEVTRWKNGTDDPRARRPHEWRNYLDDQLLKIWEHLTPRERKLCYLFCSEQASSEEWD